MKTLLAVRITVVMLLLLLGSLSINWGYAVYGPRGSGESTIILSLKNTTGRRSTLSSFGATGVAIIHIYINWRALIYYLKNSWKQYRLKYLIKRREVSGPRGRI